MPTVFEVRAEYHRTVAPRDYEKVHGTVEYKATVAEGEDVDAVTNGLITKARTFVDGTVFAAAKARQAEVAAAVSSGQPVPPLAKAAPTTTVKAPAKTQPKEEPKPDPAAVAAPAEPTAPAEPDPAAVAPEAPAAAPAEAPTPDPEITDADLSTKAAEYAKAKGPDKVKGVMKVHKVMRLGELTTQEARKKFLADLEAL